MFSEHLSSLPVDVFLKSHQQGIQRQLNMHPMDLSGWLFLSLSLSLLAEPPPRDPRGSPAPQEVAGDTCTGLARSSLGERKKKRKRPDEIMNNERYVARG